MTITEIRVYPVWVGHRNQCLVKVETDQGIHGWGESGLSYRELAVEYEALRRLTDVPFAIGEEFSSKWEFLPYLERGITNFARL
ncbi:MAG: hypothetical protein M3301_01510, partial [Chloroflexota bacterium]|nr:hypothetical protein [Chloroflexota bacterium]